MQIMFDDPGVAEAIRTYVWETAPVVVLYLNVDNCLVDANAQARRILPDAAFGRPLHELIVDFTGTLDLPALIRQGSGAVLRITLSTISGMPETLYFRFFPFSGGTLALGSLDFQEQQKMRYEVLALNRELNNMTRELHQANAQLRELNELKNRFIGMAAHDLRKPVGIMMTYNEFVLDEAKDLGDEQRDFLRAGLAAAAGMKRLIDNFLDVSIIESGHLRLERSSTDIAEILSGVLPMVSLIASRKKIELLIDAQSDKNRLTLDVGKIQQVLINLLSNAIEHSRAGQRVWLTACREDTQLVFSVRDEGRGISPEDQKKLFEPFVRAGTSKTAGERSVGLGLAIARLVVEAHGGRIWVQSIPGEGATFFTALPAGYADEEL